MKDLDQVTLNLRYAQAQERRMIKLAEENIRLKELIEALRIHLISVGDKYNG